ncbi:sulfite exporter TauE/SafE family protein [Psychrobacter sp. I-STPA10]|uniref:sulfite exporter TauE/SafE family protein n=1 Tax=Psychrobacter sp. I-STPA10 TaxID=2585769 RepID=UPI001E45D2E0|nr:sulfite exporter TauE/SafE family protein [Psychrobacter sp. I-STPA10]
MSFALLAAAFAMGLFGSPHCLGMCGGLVTAFGLSMQNVSARKRRALIATYHFGRLSSYALLGLLAGLIGTVLLAPIMNNNWPRVLLGMMLVFIGMAMLGAPFLNKLEKVGMRFWQKLSPIRQKVFPLTTFPRALAAGLLWGFLPCGLVYGALLMAVVGHSALTGAALMFTFGLGTIPMLVATHEAVAWMRNHIGRLRLRQMNGALMVVSGLAVIAVPVMMSTMHGGHHHGGHQAGMASMQHNHDMADHSMHDMASDMDSDMHTDHEMSHMDHMEGMDHMQHEHHHSH